MRFCNEETYICPWVPRSFVFEEAESEVTKEHRTRKLMTNLDRLIVYLITCFLVTKIIHGHCKLFAKSEESRHKPMFSKD